jgi:hypothetical protein
VVEVLYFDKTTGGPQGAEGRESVLYNIWDNRVAG